MSEESLDPCRWCGGLMIQSPDGGYGVVCEACWWPSSECRCPIRPELVTDQTPQGYREFRACGHGWPDSRTETETEPGHSCGRPLEHNGHHTCSECLATVENPASFLSA